MRTDMPSKHGPGGRSGDNGTLVGQQPINWGGRRYVPCTNREYCECQDTFVALNGGNPLFYKLDKENPIEQEKEITDTRGPLPPAANTCCEKEVSTAPRPIIPTQAQKTALESIVDHYRKPPATLVYNAYGSFGLYKALCFPTVVQTVYPEWECAGADRKCIPIEPQRGTAFAVYAPWPIDEPSELEPGDIFGGAMFTGLEGATYCFQLASGDDLYLDEQETLASLYTACGTEDFVIQRPHKTYMAALVKD